MVSQAVHKLILSILLTSDLLEKQENERVMYAENQSAIKLVMALEFHKRTKHIDFWYY